MFGLRWPRLAVSNLFFQLRHLYDFLHLLTGLWRQVPRKSLRCQGEDKVGRGRERDCFLQHVGFLVIDTNQTQKPLSELLFVCLLDFVVCLLVGWDLQGVLQRFSLASNALFAFPAAIRPAWSENLYIAHRAICSYRAALVCSSGGISWCRICPFQNSASSCTPVPGLSQPLLLLSNQLHCCCLP